MKLISTFAPLGLAASFLAGTVQAAERTPYWKVTGTGSNYWPVHDASSGGTNTTWIKGAKMCGSVSNCYDPDSPAGLQECTTTGLGYCGDDTWPHGDFFVTRVENIGLVMKSKYQACADLGSCDDASTPTFEKGYRDISPNNGNDVAFIQTGALTNDPISSNSDVSYAYVSVASYLNIGSADIETNTNNFYQASLKSSDNTPKDAVTSRDSNFPDSNAHPDNAESICIADLKNAACGDNVAYGPDAYKFSIFVKLVGNDWDTVAADDSYDHYFVRMMVNHPDTWTPYVNEYLTLEEAASVDATKIMFDVNSQFTLKFEFKTTFNIGDVGTYNTPTATKSLTIRISKKDEKSFYVDYLFPKADIGSDNYFVYDPTITFDNEKLTVPPTPSPFSAGARVTSALSLVLSLGLLCFVHSLF